MDRAGFMISAFGTLMAVAASCLLLYTATLIFSQSLLPAIRAEEVGLARASIGGLDFSGYGVLLPMVIYLALGFLALALANRQARRARRIWHGHEADQQ